MLKILAWTLSANLILSTLGLGFVTQCYHCNSPFCGDTYDSRLGAVASCFDLYKNAMTYSNAKLIVNDSQLASIAGNSDDIETFAIANSTKTSARFFDINRKIWEFFNKGEIDETTQFACVKANYDENGQTLTYRGCVPKYTRSISTACDFVNQKVTGASTGTISSCYTCESNLCNSGAVLKASALTVAAAVVLRAVGYV
ncbi:uncharacterized protein [Euwallacea fornicatus]|uniref:uncharacterized protein isoform X2 n=1 Tax=Euwallacea fornicatus TaxID=995702 RepID=UPI00338F0B55